MGMSSCADEDYTSKYNDPSQTTTASISKLFTGVMYAGREYTFNSYWRMYTWDNGVLGKYAQTIGFQNSEGALWSAQDSYANNRWVNFYSVLQQYRVLENELDKLSDSDKANNQLFKTLAEVFVYDHLSQIIDTFGDCPFTEAGYLAVTGDVAGSYPSYDDATTLYKTMLSRLGTIYNEIKAAKGTISALTASSLTSQDFLMNHDKELSAPEVLDAWARYANSLRLRLAVRVSSQGALVAEGKAAVAECVGRDLVAETSQNIVAVPDLDGFNYWQNFRDGWKDHSRASQAMLDVLCTEKTVGQNDPRLPVMYSKNAKGEYKGYSTSETLDIQTANAALPEKDRVYSRIDSTLFYENQKMLSPVLCAAEVDFLKAEAYQAGWANGNAKQAFIDGMVHSTEFYFNQNMTSSVSYGYKAPAAPAKAEVEAYAAKLWDSNTDKMEVIMAQKWLNFGFYQQVNAWDDIRRTGKPSHLVYNEDPTAQMFKTIPNRVRYPASERTSNTVKYNEQMSKMGGNDDAYQKIFWAK